MGLKRPKQHEINRKAMAIFEKAIAGWASANPHPEDYGIDYTVEVFLPDTQADVRQASGVEFQVQLKGTENLRCDEKAVKHSIETAKVKYYVDNKRLPVFLVVIDINRMIGCYQFMQDYALQHLRPDWREQSTVQVLLPLANTIFDEAVFMQAAQEADKKMTQYRPAALHGALRAEKMRIESMDPRLEVDIGARDGKLIYVLNPRTDIPATLNFAGQRDNLEQLMKDMFEQGKQIDLKEYGVHAKLNGMPALDQVDSSIGAIQVYRSRPGACIIELVHNDRVANSMELAGEWELGNSCGRFEAGMPYNLLKIRVSLAINSNGRSNNTYDFDVNLNCWKSRNINDDLPYFIQMHMLFLTKSEGASLRMRLLADGNQIVTIPFEVPQTDVLKFLAYVVDSVNRLRFIAKQTNVDFGLFDIKEMCNANTIEFVYLLLAGNTPTLKNLVCNVTTESVGSTYREGTTYLWSVKFVQPMFPVLVLGKSIECGPVELMYDDAELLASSVTPTDVGQRVTWRISSSRSISVRRFNATDTVPVKSDASGAS